VSRFTDLLFARRDVLPTPAAFVGFPSDGGVLPAGVSGTTSLGISAVWRSLDILANGVSQLDWEERRQGLTLPSSRLVNRPQSQRTRREWVSLVVSTLALYDVCYLLKAGGTDSEGVPMSLVYLQPALVQPRVYDQWQILPPTEYFVHDVETPATDLVIIHRSPQPGVLDTFGGVIQLARATFAAAIAAENYSSRYWQGGGRPSLYLTTDANLSDPVANSLGERWTEKRRLGPDHPPVLSGGLKAVETGIDPTQASAVEARRELVADIGRYFGIPTRILNAPTGDSETYHTSEAGNQDLVRYTLRNYIRAIEDAITDQLPGGRYMEMDITPLIEGVQLNRFQAYQFALGGKAWMLPEDVRNIERLPPVENPEELNPPPPAPVVAAPDAMPMGGPNG
jgi:HK97 family phage portal protein